MPLISEVFSFILLATEAHIFTAIVLLSFISRFVFKSIFPLLAVKLTADCEALNALVPALTVFIVMLKLLITVFPNG